MEAIILAGGFGTRLKSVVQELPKPMAPIRDKPFLEYLLKYLIQYDVSHFILCTGYKSEAIETCFGKTFEGVPITYSVETEPLGTGGAILGAVLFVKSDDFIVLNGDSFFMVDFDELAHFHRIQQSDFTLALKKMVNFDRYGTVVLDGDRITSFAEKRQCNKGLINGGVYIVKKTLFDKLSLPKKFSLEKDLLEKHINNIRMSGFVSDSYFIDIGIPEDYSRAQKEIGL